MSQLTLDEFADKLNEIIPVLMKEMHSRQTNELFKGKITFPQFFVLSYLEKLGPQNMTELARVIAITTAGMTGIIERLVKGGYVRRESDPKDRRVIIIHLAQKGCALVRKINEERRQTIVDVFGKISEEERHDYLNILKHILETFTEQKEV